jgi:hypothetical protein
MSKSMDDIIQKFDLRIKNPEPHIVALLAEIDGIRGEFKSGLRMTPQAITSLKQSVLITSAGASTRIEGAKLTDDEVEKVMQGLAVSKFADRDSQEVQGYLEVLQNVFDAFQTLPLRESVISKLRNRKTLHNFLNLIVGEFRTLDTSRSTGRGNKHGLLQASNRLWRHPESRLKLASNTIDLCQESDDMWFRIFDPEIELLNNVVHRFTHICYICDYMRLYD